MSSSVNNSATHRLRVGAGSGMLVAIAAMLPLSVSAATIATTVGAVTNVTKPLAGRSVNAGDYLSSGWAISMSGSHPAATVKLTNLSATIPLTCQVPHQPAKQLNAVLQMPDASPSFAANDTVWHATASAADVLGYQVGVAAGDLCQGGSLTPNGNAKYTASLTSTDTTDPFALRFHTVDARTNVPSGSTQVNPNTNCALASQNTAAVSPCSAPWTAVSTAAAAPAPVPVPEPVPVPIPPPVVNGTVNAIGGAAGSVGSLVKRVVAPVVHPLHHESTRVGGTADGSGTSASAPAQPGGVRAATTPPAPLVVPQPSPAQSTVLGPVPLPVPVIDSVAAGVGGALPWKWFVLLAILDLGLIVGIVIRRRSGQRDRLRAR